MSVRGGYVISDVPKTATNSNDVTVCLSGVLARGYEQFAPVMQSLPGNVITIHTEGRKHDIGSLVNLAVEAALTTPKSGVLRIIGASMGGMEVPFVVGKVLKARPELASRLEVVLIDAPSGLKSLANPMAKVMKSGLVAGVVTNILPKFVTVPGGPPDRSSITVPADAAQLADVYKDQVIETAKEYMSGFPMSLFLDQTRWMIAIRESGILPKAAEVLRRVKVTYVKCTLQDDVVNNDIAAADWLKWCPNIDVVEVQGIHCGFLYNQPEFTELFGKMFVGARTF